MDTVTNPENNPDNPKRFNPQLRQALEDYQERRKLTQSELAKELNTGITQVNKYLNGKPEGDIARLESIIEDVLNNESRRVSSQNDDFDTPVTKSIASACETIRKTNDFALITGGAGIGKTAGIRLYHAKNPTCIVVTAYSWCCSSHQVEAALFAQMSNRSYNGRTKRADWLVARLASSNRLMIIDNAQRLTPKALAWLFDFHDATGCPVALVGNPETLDVIKCNDQMFSRVGLKHAIAVKPKQVREVTDGIVKQLLPDAGNELGEFAAVVGEHHGHYRSVRKELMLTRTIKDASKEPLSWASAFSAAHTKLIRDYNL